MNARKLDLELRSALRRGRGPFEVFVKTVAPPSLDERSELAALGVRDLDRKGCVFAASATRDLVEKLSEARCVRSIRLAQRLTLAG